MLRAEIRLKKSSKKEHKPEPIKRQNKEELHSFIFAHSLADISCLEATRQKNELDQFPQQGNVDINNG